MIQIGLDVIKYIDSNKESFAERWGHRKEVNSIIYILETLGNRLKDTSRTESQLPTLTALAIEGGQREQVRDILEDIERKLASSRGLRDWRNALTWPFKKQDVDNMLNKINLLSHPLMLALQDDGMFVVTWQIKCFDGDLHFIGYYLLISKPA